MVDADDRAVLTDFGNAKEVPVYDYATWKGYSRDGTCPYMAPEMVSADVHSVGYGTGVDVWSMGLAFLQILDFIPKRYFLAESLNAIRKEHGVKLPINFTVPADFDVAFARIVQMVSACRRPHRVFLYENTRNMCAR